MLKEIEKTRILQYLQFAQKEVDLLHFAEWLEVYSDGLFHINRGKRPKERNNYFVNDRKEKRDERTRG